MANYEQKTMGEYIWMMCLDCAWEVRGATIPEEEYVNSVARLLYGTAAHESGMFEHTRQIGFEFGSGRGGHGYWQMEVAALYDVQRRLDRDPNLRANFLAFYYGYRSTTSTPEDPLEGDSLKLVQRLCGDHRLCCAAARIYFANVPEPVPEGPQRQAKYWYENYNRSGDPRRIEKWAHDFERASALIEFDNID